MAKTKDEEKKKPEGGEKSQPPKAQQPKTPKQPRQKAAAPAAPAADEPEEAGPPPKPRLRDHYHAVVRPKLSQQFGFGNPHQVPKLTKIVLNVGAGEANKNPKMLDSVVAELGAITGQKPVVTRAKKAISNFGLREGMPIGAA